MRPLRHEQYTAGWICALPLELAAACTMLDERHDPLPLERGSRDNNTYVLGRIGRHNVAIACLPSGITGTVSAAKVVNQMLATFKRLKFGLMVGIGGGAPSGEHDIRLGDVVVGTPTGLLGGVIQYDFGKTVQQGHFQRTGMLNKPPEVLLSALSNLQANHFMQGHDIEKEISNMVDKYPAMRAQYSRPNAESDRLYKADYEHPLDERTCSSCDPTRVKLRVPRSSGLLPPSIHYGLIASGDQVVKHGAMRDKLRQELDVLCFEMEAAGLVDSFPCLVIRGISDYADSHKNDHWQGYAAATAAAYAKELMGVIPGSEAHGDLYASVEVTDNNISNIRFDVQQWLSPATVNDDLFTHQMALMSGSCDWALETKELKLFFASITETEILRIKGPPGSGKSTLAAFITRHLIETKNAYVLYFFCKATDENKSQPFQVLRTLLSQLLIKDGESHIYTWLDKLRLQGGQKSAESFATLYEAFQYALASKLTRPPVYIVVDALDECQDGSLLASSLLALLNSSKGIIKLILTSREDPDLWDLFDQRFIHTPLPRKDLAVLPEHVRQPILAYVRERVSQCKHISGTSLGHRVLRKVSAAADGSWLYARLMMDEIQRLPSAASVERQLLNTPDGLVQLYQRIFETMEKPMTPLQLRLSQQVFLWVDMTDFIYVGRNDLDREILDIIFQAENSGEEVFDSVDLVKRLCSPLIALNMVGRGRTSRLKISFVHHTAAQFLRQSTNREYPNETIAIPMILRPQALKALYRGITGAWYFQASTKSTLLLDSLRSNPSKTFATADAYFEMAYGLWNAFFLKTLPDCLDNVDLEQASILCNKLTGFLLSESCLKWVEMAIIINYDGGFTNLFENVIKALYAAETSLTTANNDSRGKQLLAFQSYSSTRRQFFADYAYVISLTGPSTEANIINARRAEPDGFKNRRLAAKLLFLGQKWKHLYTNVFP